VAAAVCSWVVAFFSLEFRGEPAASSGLTILTYQTVRNQLQESNYSPTLPQSVRDLYGTITAVIIPELNALREEINALQKELATLRQSAATQVEST